MSALKNTKTLSEWLDELAERHPKHEIRLGLARMQEAACRMGITNPNARVVTIAGTNGKGSCLMLLERLLISTNNKVGCFQSPHLRSFCERIRINGKNASEESIVKSFDTIDKLCGDLSLTFFEWNTLAALDIFKQNQLDFILLEVGLGGRLDAVNIIDNELSIITAIDYDHTDWLGDTLEQIAGEKAGVIRPYTNVISHSQISSITGRCDELNAKAQYFNKDFSIEVIDKKAHFSAKGDNGTELSCVTPLPGGCIADNMALALQAWLKLGFELNAALTDAVFANMVLPARQEHIKYKNKNIILDVSHNKAGIKSLATRVKKDFANLPAVAIFAMLQDKQPPTNLQDLFPTVKRWLLLSIYGARGQTSKELNDILKLDNCLLLDNLDTISIDEIFGEESLLIVAGSFHTSDAFLHRLDQ